MDYVHFRDSGRPITKVAPRCECDGKIMTYKLLQVFVELPKFAAKVHSGMPGGERFLCALRDIGKADDRPTEMEGKDLDQFFRASSYVSLDKDEQSNYDKEMRTKEEVEEYYQILLNEARENALANGRSEGIESTARKMKAMGWTSR